jgi:hypothetical protein
MMIEDLKEQLETEKKNHDATARAYDAMCIAYQVQTSEITRHRGWVEYWRKEAKSWQFKYSNEMARNYQEFKKYKAEIAELKLSLAAKFKRWVRRQWEADIYYVGGPR